VYVYRRALAVATDIIDDNHEFNFVVANVGPVSDCFDTVRHLKRVSAGGFPCSARAQFNSYPEEGDLLSPQYCVSVAYIHDMQDEYNANALYNASALLRCLPSKNPAMLVNRHNGVNLVNFFEVPFGKVGLR